MKFFIYIFSTYILLLCAMPCTDMLGASDSYKAKSSVNKEPANPHEDETCSPFCICFCCGSLAVSACSPVSLTPETVSYKHILPLLATKLKYISFSVWQPPKQA